MTTCDHLLKECKEMLLVNNNRIELNNQLLTANSILMSKLNNSPKKGELK